MLLLQANGMIDECDLYLLVIGGRYGSIDEETGMSYTEKEYNYAKTKGLPVLVLIKEPSAITETANIINTFVRNITNL